MAKRLTNKKKHTLDSDEEDYNENVKTMKYEDIEGQEDCDVDFEDGVRFTPFHMKDELEEGAFDENLMYIFKKNNQIKDEWIDEVNWTKVKEMEKTLKYKENKVVDTGDEKEEKLDETAIMKSMLAIMCPKETVTKAIKRLDKVGGTIGAWQKKKKQKLDSELQNSEISKQHLADMISYADKLFSLGTLDIYQETYESLNFQLSEKSKHPTAVDEIDIFGSNEPKPVTSKDSYPDNVQWELKWKSEDVEIHGPFSSQQMLTWQEEGIFKDGVLVRKLEEGNEVFYNPKRIDFGLYI